MKFAFIEAHLAKYGHVARRDFKCCAAVTATKILTKYKEAHPLWVTYSTARKRYECTQVPTFYLKRKDATKFLDAYDIIYGDGGSPNMLLVSEHSIEKVDGNYLHLGQCGGIVAIAPDHFKPQVGGYYCVPVTGRPFFMLDK